MALKLVTAPPGTGKTLLLIRMIFEYLAQGRRVFSNISDLKITEVLPIPYDQDWRDLPDGSVVIYDEGHEHPAFSKEDIIDYPEFEEPEQLKEENITTYRNRLSSLKEAYNKQKKRHRDSILDIARALKMHRHWGFDIIIATQDSSELNTRVTNIVGEHYHLTRPFGFRHNVLFFWRRHVSNPDSTSERSRAEWKKNMKFNKSYFHLYHSSNKHTHNSNFPIKYVIFGTVVLALIFTPIYYALTKNKAVKLYTGEDRELIATQNKANEITINQEMPKDPKQLDAFLKEQQLQQERESKLEQQRQIYQQTLQKEQEQEISGCVYFNGKYTAVDEYARPIYEKSHLCKKVIQDADRNVMKKPTRASGIMQNNYSQQSTQDLETARTVEAQREMFNEP